MARQRAPESDAELVERTLAGDRRAAELLVLRYTDEVRRVFLRGRIEPATVDDLTQETLLCCVRRLPTLERHDRFRGWLLEIARHKLLDHLRRVRRRRARFERADGSREYPCERSNAAISAIEAQDERRVLGEALAQLSRRSQSLVRQYHWQGLSRLEIAERLGIPVGTVGSRLHYAHKRLARLLERQLD